MPTIVSAAETTKPQPLTQNAASANTDSTRTKALENWETRSQSSLLHRGKLGWATPAQNERRQLPWRTKSLNELMIHDWLTAAPQPYWWRKTSAAATQTEANSICLNANIRLIMRLIKWKKFTEWAKFIRLVEWSCLFIRVSVAGTAHGGQTELSLRRLMRE